MVSNESQSDLVTGLLSGSAIIFVGNLVGMGSAFLARFFAARHLAPDGYGLLVLGITAHNILVLVVMLGFQDGLPREMAREEDTTPLVSSALLLVLALSSISGFALFAVRGLAADSMGIPEADVILGLFGLSLPAYAFLNYLVAVFRGLEDARSRVLVENILRQGLGLSAVLVGLLLGLDAVGMARVWVGAVLAAAILSLPIAARRTTIDVSSIGWLRTASPAVVKDLAVFSIPLMASGAIWQLMQYSDNYLLAVLLSSESAVGIYDASFTFGKLLIVGATTVQFLLVPMLSRLDAEENFVAFRRLYQQSTRWIILFTLPLFLVIVSNSSLILSIVYGGDYSGGSLVLAIVVSGFFAHVLSGTNGGALNAVGRTRIIVLANALAFLGNISLNIVFIPLYGIEGAAAASAVSYVLVNLIYSIRLYRQEGVWPISALTAKAMGLSIGVYGLVFLLARNYVTSLLGIVALTIGYGLIYLVITLTIGVTENEINSLQQISKDLVSMVQCL